MSPAQQLTLIDYARDLEAEQESSKHTNQDRRKRRNWIVFATHPDRVCPTDRPIVLPDCGAICALLESATGRRPEAIPGKPSPAMLDTVCHVHELEPHEVAMVGDRIYTDVRMGLDAGAIAILTLTGETKQKAVDQCAAADRPDIVIRDLGELSRLIEKACDVR